MGRNGSGKSSLMWALQGSRKRAGGTVAVAGRDPEALPPTNGAGSWAWSRRPQPTCSTSRP